MGWAGPSSRLYAVRRSCTLFSPSPSLSLSVPDKPNLYSFVSILSRNFACLPPFPYGCPIDLSCSADRISFWFTSYYIQKSCLLDRVSSIIAPAWVCLGQPNSGPHFIPPPHHSPHKEGCQMCMKCHGACFIRPEQTATRAQ